MNDKSNSPTRLTQYSHGSGCGCKIAPGVLQEILGNASSAIPDKRMLVGNDSFDDAAVFDFDEENAIISTTDFFTPIVDDPFDFGAISAVNAISDVYAMGGMPIMAISILGWPVDKLSTDIASRVISGAKDICEKAGISLAGGHSIDTPEPIFGLAVTGRVNKKNIKRNDGALSGCNLYLTKPLGIGIMTTAQKHGVLSKEDLKTTTTQMLMLNKIGSELGELDGVRAVTDVTGFGLLGHLLEMCQASGVSASIDYDQIPKMENLNHYIKQKCIPGGTLRNFASYGDKVVGLTEETKIVLCDPQTSGGLLICTAPDGDAETRELFVRHGLPYEPFGKITENKDLKIYVQ